MPLLTYDVSEVLLSREHNKRGERTPIKEWSIPSQKEPVIQCAKCGTLNVEPESKPLTLGAVLIKLLDMDPAGEEKKRDLKALKEDMDLTMDITVLLRHSNEGTEIKIDSKKIDDLLERLERAVGWTRHQTAEAYRLIQKTEEEQEQADEGNGKPHKKGTKRARA